MGERRCRVSRFVVVVVHVERRGSRGLGLGIEFLPNVVRGKYAVGGVVGRCDFTACPVELS
jgi:hypothetical protein